MVRQPDKKEITKILEHLYDTKPEQFANACKMFGVKVPKSYLTSYRHLDSLETKLRKHKDPKFCLDLIRTFCK